MGWKDVFGFAFSKDPTKVDVEEGLSGGSPSTVSFVAPENYDGTAVLETGGFMSSVYDFGGTFVDENSLIHQYRSMSLYPEVDMAIEDIITESIVFDSKGEAVKLNLDSVNLSDNIKAKIQNEFINILKMMDFKNKGYEIFRRWYIESKLYYQLIIDMDSPEKGIIELRAIDPTKIRKVRKVEKEIRKVNGMQVPLIKKVDEHYVYTEMETNAITTTTAAGIKISTDSITYCNSGYMDQTTKKIVGYLHKAIRPLNMLRQIEDAVVIYRISRAPERRIFYVDVGNLPKQKAEQYLKDLMNRYRNKLVYDSGTGEIKDTRNHMSMLEDYWLPRREGGRGTEISTLPGGQNLGEMEDVEYLLRKLYRSLNVPLTRMEVQTGFNLGRSSEITRDEVKFYKFIERLRNKFSFLFMDILKKQCILKGIMTVEDWNKIYTDVRFEFTKDSYFTELKENEILREKVEMLTVLATYSGSLFSNKYIRKNILKQTDEEITAMDKEMEAERQQQLMQQMQMQQMGIEPDQK